MHRHELFDDAVQDELAEAPPFSQGALQEFRDRLIAADMDRRVLERTVALAKATQAFDHRKLPKTLRVAIDPSPLAGAGPVEDTFLTPATLLVAP